MSGIKSLLNLCFVPHPLLQNHHKISIINCFDAVDVLINVEMLVMPKKIQFCPILAIIKILDQK